MPSLSCRQYTSASSNNDFTLFGPDLRRYVIYINGSQSIPERFVRMSYRGLRHQTLNMRPMPPVTSIAIIPQNITRKVGRNGGAPPATASIIPRMARITMEIRGTLQDAHATGVWTAAGTGITSSDENAMPNAKAACRGFAAVAVDSPNSSQACASKHHIS